MLVPSNLETQQPQFYGFLNQDFQQNTSVLYYQMNQE